MSKATELSERLGAEADTTDISLRLLGRGPDERSTRRQASKELRRLDSLNTELLKALKALLEDATTSQGVTVRVYNQAAEAIIKAEKV